MQSVHVMPRMAVHKARERCLDLVVILFVISAIGVDGTGRGSGSRAIDEAYLTSGGGNTDLTARGHDTSRVRKMLQIRIDNPFEPPLQRPTTPSGPTTTPANPASPGPTPSTPGTGPTTPSQGTPTPPPSTPSTPSTPAPTPITPTTPATPPEPTETSPPPARPDPEPASPAPTTPSAPTAPIAPSLPPPEPTTSAPSPAPVVQPPVDVPGSTPPASTPLIPTPTPSTPLPTPMAPAPSTNTSITNPLIPTPSTPPLSSQPPLVETPAPVANVTRPAPSTLGPNNTAAPLPSNLTPPAPVPDHLLQPRPPTPDMDVVIHLTRPKDRLQSLAKYYQTEVDAIRSANNLPAGGEPAAGTMIRVPTPQVASYNVYPSISGDTLDSVAKQFQLLPEQLAHDNPSLDSNPDAPIPPETQLQIRVAPKQPFEKGEFQAVKPQEEKKMTLMDGLKTILAPVLTGLAAVCTILYTWWKCTKKGRLFKQHEKARKAAERERQMRSGAYPYPASPMGPDIPVEQVGKPVYGMGHLPASTMGSRDPYYDDDDGSFFDPDRTGRPQGHYA